MRVNLIFIFLLCTLVCFGSLCLTGCVSKDKHDAIIVAKIGDDYQINKSDLKKYVYDNFFDKIFKHDLKGGFEKALDLMITSQLKFYEFFDRGLDSNDELLQDIQRSINEELIVEYFEKEFLGKYTSDEFVRKTYEEMGRQVIYQQIILNKPGEATEQQLNSLIQLAEQISSDLRVGTEFAKVIEKYSQYLYPATAHDNEYVADWDKSMAVPLDREIFRLNTGDVKVLDTYDAYHVVKVRDTQKVDLEPFEEIKDQIVAKLKNAYNDISLKEYERIKEESLDENSIKWNQKTLNQVVNWSTIPDFYETMYKDTLKNAIKSGRNGTILTYPDGKVDFEEYLRLLKYIVIPKNSKNIDEEGIRKFIIEAIRTSKMVEKAKALGLKKDIFQKKTNNAVLKAEVVKIYNNVILEEQTPEANPENLKEFYESQKDSIYHLLDKVNIYTMIYNDRQKADDVMEQINEGTPFEKISGRWFVKTFIRDRNGEIKPYAKSDGPFLGNIAFQLKLNEIFGPVEYHDPEKGDQYAVVKCINIRPEKQLLYNDIKETIEKDFTEYYRKIILAKNKAELWQKYDIQIFEDALPTEMNTKN